MLVWLVDEFVAPAPITAHDVLNQSVPGPLRGAEPEFSSSFFFAEGARGREVMER